MGRSPRYGRTNTLAVILLLFLSQVVLSQLYEWTDLVAQLPPRLLTSYSLLSVSTVPVVERVEPQLAAILEELTAVGMQRAMALCKKVLEDIKQRVEVSHIYSPV